MNKNIRTRIKHILLKFTKRFSHLRTGVTCNKQWYGNTYGGFYVCPELLNENSIVYSFGIGEDVSFDTTIIAHHNCHVFGFDPTPKSINWINSQTLSENFHFYEYGISDKSGFVDFYLPKNPDHVSGSAVTQTNVDTKYKVNVQMKTLQDIMTELGHDHIDVLKMDIEGSEYDVIENILNTKMPITQMLIEFHDRFFENGHLKSRSTVELMKRNGYEIFAISDSFEEISFVKTSAL